MCVGARFEPTRVHFGDPETTSLKENIQEAYLLQFLAKRGAEKSQLGVFGRSEAIEAIYLTFWAL
jgi:hypothetical protein